jgi:hypothetical protein
MDLTRALELVTVEDESPDVYRVIASTPQPSDGLHVPAEAWNFDRFRANPVLTWTHNPDEPPIGRVPEIGPKGGNIEAVLDFAEGLTERATDIARLWAAGYCRAVSVGANFIQPPVKRGRGLAMRPNSLELCHLAVVQVGQDPQALAVARALNISEDTIRAAFSPPTDTVPQPRRIDIRDKRLRLLRLGA